MSKAGMDAARRHAKHLPRFRNQKAAEDTLFADRDALLTLLSEVSVASTAFDPDYSPESLKALESWYFELWEDDGFGGLSLDRETFERCMAMYFGEVIVRNDKRYEWIVQEFAFEKGKYEMGISRPGFAVMLRAFRDHYALPNNKRRQRIWRRYREYAA